MVIMYKMNPFTAFLAKKFVRSTKYFGLINLVLDRLVVPEVFQEQAEAENLARLLGEMIESPSTRSEIQASLRPARECLGSNGATVRVSQALASYWGEGARV